MIAALLQGGLDCVLSDEAAAELWGLVPGVAGSGASSRSRWPAAGSRTPAGLRVHRVPILDGRDVRIRDGLPVTAPARTLIDLAAGDCDDATCAEALAIARRLRLVSDAEIDDVLDRHPRRSGRARLRRLHAAERGVAITRSEAERRVYGGCSRRRICPPRRSTRSWPGWRSTSSGARKA